MAKQAQAVTVSLADLKSGSVSLETLQAAFGPDSLGILVVKDVPPEFAHLRRLALSYASYLANLPADELRKLENPQAKYLTGWSRGKERLRDGQPDTLKGSYYANCAFYVDPALDCAAPGTASSAFTAASFPEYLSPNTWPPASTLPGFKPALTQLCTLMIDVAVLVARACDRFAEQEIDGYPRGYLERVVGTSSTTKARLLHYFPHGTATSSSSNNSSGGGGGSGEGKGEGEGGEDEDDWCATHLDHGCLTALTSAMFVDEARVDTTVVVPPPHDGTTTETSVGDEGDSSGSASLSPIEELPASPDPSAGLYIVSRTGETYQVRIPRDCLAFQTGETLERITAGRFKAVPHYVRGVSRRAAAGGGGGAIARNTLAVFTQPNLEDEVDMAQHLTFGEFARGVVARNTVQ